MKVVVIVEIYNDESPVGYLLNYDILKPEHKDIIDEEIKIEKHNRQYQDSILVNASGNKLEPDYRQIMNLYEHGCQNEEWKYAIPKLPIIGCDIIAALDIYETNGNGNIYL